MNRMWAIVEREMRKFFRSPALMLMSMTLPLVQLIILGNAFGGKITNSRMGVVDYDQARKLSKSMKPSAVAANIRTFTTVAYTDEQTAKDECYRQNRRRGYHSRTIFAAGAGWRIAPHWAGRR